MNIASNLKELRVDSFPTLAPGENPVLADILPGETVTRGPS